MSASLDAEGESTERDVVWVDDGTTNEGEGKIKGESDMGENKKRWSQHKKMGAIIRHHRMMMIWVCFSVRDLPVLERHMFWLLWPIFYTTRTV